MHQQINAGLRDIFTTILKGRAGAIKALPPIIVLAGNGHVIAPGGTVHVIHQPPGAEVIRPEPVEGAAELLQKGATP